jgi:hypothetical protein
MLWLKVEDWDIRMAFGPFQQELNLGSQSHDVFNVFKCFIHCFYENRSILGFQNYHDIKQGTLLIKVIPQILSLCSNIDFDNTRGQRKGVYTLLCQKKVLYM